MLMSFLLVVLVALSLSAVSAADVADDVIAVDDSVDIISESYQPEANTADAVQVAVDSAKNDGDIVDLSNYETYDFANATVNVPNSNIVIKGNGETTIKGHGVNDGLIYVTGSNVTIQGLQFIDTNPANNLVYNGTVEGIAVKFMGVSGASVQDCEFTDFNQDIRVQRSQNVEILNNEFLGGMATKLINDPTVNKEQGTKALNIMGSTNITVKNNVFGGPMLDAVSIASGSGQSAIENNTFVGNAYAIYFGGASTAGCSIADNTFIRCGSFKEGDIVMEGFPVISIQKSSDNIVFRNNTFQAVENSILIAAEAGNTAHGGETQIGNVTVVGNTVVPYEEPQENYTADVSNVTLFHVLIREAGVLNLTSPLNVTENTFVGDVKGVSIVLIDKEIFSAANVYLNETLDVNHAYGAETLYGTTLTVETVDGYVGDEIIYKITLKDSNGVGLYNKEIIIFLNDNFIKAYTDSEGVASDYIVEQAATEKYLSAVFLGEGNMYAGSYDSGVIKVDAKDSKIAAKKATFKAKKKTKKYAITLKSKSGDAIAKVKVAIKVNGKTYKATTNAKGKATFKITKLTKKGKYNAKVTFAGNDAYKASKAKVKIIVK